MSLIDSTTLVDALSLAKAVQQGDLSPVDVAEAALAHTDALIGADGIGAYLHVDGTAVRQAATRVQTRLAAGERLPLAGVPVAIKDNIAHQHQPLGCASLALRGHRATYSATAVTRLEQAGAIIIGRTNMDEHAMGSSTERSAYHTTLNPWDADRVPGGSSGGSAAAVAVGAVPIALGSDTGGSVRQPAAFCGVVGLRPTWGRVSRSGLVAFASSMDTIGPITRNVRDSALVLGIMAGADDADATTRRDQVPDYLAALDRDLDGITIGVLLEGMGRGVEPAVQTRVSAGLAALEARGARLRPVSLPDLEHAVTTYQLLGAAEAASNLARYNGTAFGVRVPADTYQEMVRRTRTQTLGPEVKLRILLGTFLLSADQARGLLERARAMRARLAQQLRHLLIKCDALATPTTPTVAFRFGERTDDPVAMYLADSLTTPATLAGLPALSVPVGMASLGLGDHMPAGLQLIGRPWEEGVLLALG
ncbi:MAG: Asp-tRNA(Asn)/Glu-tRNA(Gln) amidotransferase subunit GatA, partial [Oligoflexia bacterium]|nr:Asp-tRNA(Asn)/Glu-tRNA(Gln) amidotransferase subunit GatA [Oligoflexia bacterium]